MPILAGRQRKQRTNAASVRPSQIYNAPGIYQPIFGRSKIYVSGRGTPGSAPVPGGTYTNPTTPGNYAGTNPGTAGNVVCNPVVPGNSGTNLPSGGNVAGYNPPVMVTQNAYAVINYSQGNRTSYDSYRYITPSEMAPYTAYRPHISNVGAPSGGFAYEIWTLSKSPVSGNANYNPTVPGGPFTNSPTPGNVRYNPTTPGTPYTNSPSYVAGNYVPGNYVEGNRVPGNTNPGTTVPGNTVPSRYIAGTTVPGNTVPASYTPGNPVPGYTNPSTYSPGNLVPGYYETMIAVGSNKCPVGWINEGFHDGSNYYTQGPFCSISVEPYTNPGTVVSGNTVAPYTNQGTYVAAYTNPTYMNSSTYIPGGTNPPTYQNGNTNPPYYNSYTNQPYTNQPRYTPGNAGTNPPTPGNIVYNAGAPGNPYYNNPTPGNTVTNPPTPGNVGAPFTSLGVTFPGGPIGAPAPTVGETLVEVTYSNAGVVVNVGPQGQVVVKETL